MSRDKLIIKDIWGLFVLLINYNVLAGLEDAALEAKHVLTGSFLADKQINLQIEEQIPQVEEQIPQV